MLVRTSHNPTHTPSVFFFLVPPFPRVVFSSFHALVPFFKGFVLRKGLGFVVWQVVGLSCRLLHGPLLAEQIVLPLVERSPCHAMCYGDFLRAALPGTKVNLCILLLLKYKLYRNSRTLMLMRCKLRTPSGEEFLTWIPQRPDSLG